MEKPKRGRLPWIPMVGRRLQDSTKSEGSTLWSEGGKTFSTRKNVWLFFGKGSILKMEGGIRPQKNEVLAISASLCPFLGW